MFHLNFRNKIPLGGNTLKKDDLEIVKKWIHSRQDWYNEDIVHTYQNEFASFNECAFAFAFTGGRVALSSCIYALGLKEGDTVIIPGYTCIAVPNAFWFEGINIVFCDIELDTYGLDIVDLHRKLKAHPNTKVILLHHLYGLICKNYEDILALAQSRRIPVIEDCTHATGARFKGKRIGSESPYAFYSSEQSKIFNTFNGGIGTTCDDQIAEKMIEYSRLQSNTSKERILKYLKNIEYCYYLNSSPFRKSLHYWWMLKYLESYLPSTTEEEYNSIQPTHYASRFPAPLAAVGINQIKKIDQNNEARRNMALYWDTWCEKNGHKKAFVLPESEPVFLRYPVMVPEAMKKDHSWAKSLNIEVGDWFRTNLHPVVKDIPGCPNANAAVIHCINLPTLD